jgi:hypothetical protein
MGLGRAMVITLAILAAASLIGALTSHERKPCFGYTPLTDIPDLRAHLQAHCPFDVSVCICDGGWTDVQ